MADYRTVKDLTGKAIVSATTGQKIGTVSGVMLDPDGLRIAALSTAKGSMLKQESETIPASSVQVWGSDVILIANGDAVGREARVPGYEGWVDAADYLKGRSVISLDGKRLGKVSDILIGAKGEIVGYDLAEVSTEHPSLANKFVPARATHSLGKDVLIVDLNKLDGDERPGMTSGGGAERYDTRPL